MPLIKCPDCGREVSEKAKACPGCGRPVAVLEKERRRNAGLLILIAVFFLIFVFGTLVRSCEENKNISPSSQSSSTSAAPTPAAARISERLVDSLTFSTGKIYIGQIFDNVLKIVNAPMVNINVEKDPRLPGSLQVTKSVSFEGKRLVLVMARERDPGPYVLRSILVE